MMAEEEPVMMESEQAPSSLAAEEWEAPVFGEEVMVEEAAAEEPALLSEVTAEAEPPAPTPELSEEQRAAIAAFKDLYVNDELDVKNPYASPVYGNFDGFPPMLIQVGGREVLIDDSKKIAKKAKEAGCNVSLEVWDDMVHVFHGYAPFLPEANEALEAIGEFIADK